MAAPQGGLTVLHAQQPSVPSDRFFYDAVGKEYHGLSRRKLSDDEFAAIFHDSLNEVHVLHVDGSPAGFQATILRIRHRQRKVLTVF